MPPSHINKFLHINVPTMKKGGLRVVSGVNSYYALTAQSLMLQFFSFHTACHLNHAQSVEIKVIGPFPPLLFLLPHLCSLSFYFILVDLCPRSPDTIWILGVRDVTVAESGSCWKSGTKSSYKYQCPKHRPGLCPKHRPLHKFLHGSGLTSESTARQ